MVVEKIQEDRAYGKLYADVLALKRNSDENSLLIRRRNYFPSGGGDLIGESLKSGA